MSFRIFLGSYERLVFGLEATLKAKDDVELALKYRIKPLFILPAHLSSVRSLSTSPSGSLLASGSTDETIHIYDLQKLVDLGPLWHHSGTITSMEFHGRHFLSSGEDGSLNIYRTKDFELLKAIKGHKSGIEALAVHPTGKLALSVGRGDNTMRVFDLERGVRGAAMKLERNARNVIWIDDGAKYGVSYDRRIDVFQLEVIFVY